jgi:hypothetical protein
VNSAYRCTSQALRIIVLGYIVRGPMGGMAWHHLQYVMGLWALGHDVYFVEDSDDTPWCCYDPTRSVTDSNPTYGLQFATDTFERAGLGGRWAYYDAHSSRWFGPCAGRISEVCASADLLLNLSGANPLRPWLMDVPVRVLIETDPVFTQIRNLTDSVRRERALRHTAFFSFGENIGLSRATIPDDGLPWQATRQPIILAAWPITPGPPCGKFTTVMQWDSYAASEYEGRRYGMKSDSFAPYFDLPGSVGQILELAVGNSSAPRSLLRNKGWVLRDPGEVTRDPWTYQQYLQQSKAEFSVAKQGYVVSRSGWFSERSAAYLASGRPALLQETGFSDWLSTGSGVIPFKTPAEALAGIEEINCNYEFHCRAARAIAEEYFDARKVLSRLIECGMNFATLSAANSLK